MFCSVVLQTATRGENKSLNQTGANEASSAYHVRNILSQWLQMQIQINKQTNKQKHTAGPLAYQQATLREYLHLVGRRS
jgi:hypothetical protein